MVKKSANHSTYDTHYHIVFPIKYRKALITPQLDRVILKLAHNIEKRYDIEFETIGTDGDHIHNHITHQGKTKEIPQLRLFT